ncbi:hypothetical protein [Curvibacter sp. PAE-UM]|uniref:hypothetical protein n=1 Tax=Curvibacter sp. PAE-UM TaxID=1714344 RepID=UPI0012E32F9E|nr:hypothetical protein [Curvibacter sp. PAE-UM]
MRFLGSLVLSLVLASAPAFAGSLRLSAEPGKFNAKTLAAPTGDVSFRGTARLLAFNSSPQWPAASYIGIHQGTDRNDSVQVLAIRNRPTDDYLVIGYRLVVGGKEVKVESLVNVPVDSSMRIDIRFKNGIASIKVNDRETVEVRTPFKQVAPYVSVSSGEAEFSIDF